MCYKGMPPQIHVLFNLTLYALQFHISPSSNLIPLFSPRLTPPDLLHPLTPRRLSCVPLWGKFHPKTFPEAEKRGNFPVLPESLLILAEEQPRELSNDDSHREKGR